MIKYPGWFALNVKVGHEKAVSRRLRVSGFEEFLPLYSARPNWPDRVKYVYRPLFREYVFCHISDCNWQPVLKTPGVISLVSFGRVPAAIPDHEIDALWAVVDSGLPAQPWPFVRTGQVVRVKGGALAGLRGILMREEEPLRIVVSVELLRRSVAVAIDREMICAVDGAAHAPNANLYLTA